MCFGTSFAQEKKVTYFYISGSASTDHGLKQYYTSVQSTICYADTDRYMDSTQSTRIELQMRDHLKLTYTEHYKYGVIVFTLNSREKAEIERRRKMAGSKNAGFSVIVDNDFVYYCDEE